VCVCVCLCVKLCVLERQQNKSMKYHREQRQLAKVSKFEGTTRKYALSLGWPWMGAASTVFSYLCWITSRAHTHTVTHTHTHTHTDSVKIRLFMTASTNYRLIQLAKRQPESSHGPPAVAIASHGNHVHVLVLVLLVCLLVLCQEHSNNNKGQPQL